MEFELGLKISRIVDDFTTSANLEIAKDRAGPLFISRETDTMFILTAHLRGYKREYIQIEINEDGTQIAISGEKPVQETVMVGWKVYKNEIEMKRGFNKAFKIPDGVNLDKIKARFNEEDSILTISMPKLVKGVRGIRVEEVEEEEDARGSSESSQVTDKGVADGETFQLEEYRKPGTEDIKESDHADEKLPGAPEIVGENDFEELGTEKVEQAGSMAVVYPEEITGQEVHDLKEEQTTKKESQEAEKEIPSDSDQVIEQKEIPRPPPLVEKAQEERGLEEHEQSIETTKSIKSVPDQVIEQKEVPSPPPLVEEVQEERGLEEPEHRIETTESTTKNVPDQVIEQKEVPSPLPLVEEPQEERRLEEHDHEHSIKTVESTKSILDQVVEQKEVPSPSPLVEEAQEERGSGEHEHSIETIEPTKSVPNQVIEEKDVPSPPPSIEETRVDTDDESKMWGQESKRQYADQGIVEPKEDKGEQEHNHIESSRMKQFTDQDQEVHGKEESQKSENFIEEEEDGGDEYDEVSGVVKIPEKARHSEAPGTEKEKNLENQARQPREKGSKFCVPIIAGSAFLVTVIVLVIHFIRTQSPSSKKRN